MKKILIILMLFVSSVAISGGGQYAIQQCWNQVQAYQFYLQQKGFATQEEIQRLNQMKARCTAMQQGKY